MALYCLQGLVGSFATPSVALHSKHPLTDVFEMLRNLFVAGCSQLADALAACCKLARRVFAEQLKAHGDRLLRYPPAPPADLSPPPQASSPSQLNRRPSAAAVKLASLIF